MARLVVEDRLPNPVMPPSTSLNDREAQLVSMAYDAAEKQIREGKASSQVLTHFLKQGSSSHELELEKLRCENKLLMAKVEAFKAAQESEKRYREAIEAVLGYQGRRRDDEDYSYIFGDAEAF